MIGFEKHMGDQGTSETVEYVVISAMTLMSVLATAGVLLAVATGYFSPDGM